MSIVERDPPDWEDFDAAAKRPIEQHIRNSFIKTYKPVLDDAEYRSFDTIEADRPCGAGPYERGT
jgi:hypothetical protein